MQCNFKNATQHVCLGQVYREEAAVPEPAEPAAETMKPEDEATQEPQGQEVRLPACKP